MKKKLLVVLASLAIAAPAFASPVAQGNFGVTLPVLGINGLWWGGDFDDGSFGDDGDISINTYAASVGYFAIDNLELSLLVDWVVEQNDLVDDTQMVGLGLTYYMDMDGMMPFFGLSFAMELEAEIMMVGLDVGLAYMLSDNLAAYGAVTLVHTDFDAADVAGQELGLEAGVKMFF